MGKRRKPKIKCSSGKVRHKSKSGAEMAASKMKKRGTLLTIYPCTECQGWHLGGTKATRVININKAIDKALKADSEKRTAILNVP